MSYTEAITAAVTAGVFTYGLNKLVASINGSDVIKANKIEENWKNSEKTVESEIDGNKIIANEKITEQTNDFLNFLNKKDAEEWAENAFKSWRKTLSADEVDAFWKYTGDDCYENINAVLRGTEPIFEGNNDKYVELLTNAINKTSIPENIVLYRGTSMAMLKDLRNLPIEQWVGKNISDNAFMSTSLLSDGAFNKELILIIKAPIGSKGAFIGNMSKYPNEVEVLLNKGQEMIITEIIESTTKKTTISVELIP